MFKIEKVDVSQGLTAISEIWKRLQAPVHLSNFGTSFDVVSAAYEGFVKFDDPKFGYSKEPLILLVSRGNEPVAIAPFVKVLRDRSLGPIVKRVSCIEFLGQPSLSRHYRFFRDILSPERSPVLTESVLKWIYEHEKFDVMHLAQIAENSPSFDFSSQHLVRASTCPVIDIADFSDFASYRRSAYSQDLKQKLRAAFNRAGKRSLELTVFVEPITSEALREITRLALLKWDWKSFLYEGYSSFLEMVSNNHEVEVVFVRINGTAVAYRVYVRYGNEKYELDTGIDRTFYRLHLGALMIDKVIETSFAQGISTQIENAFSETPASRFATNVLDCYKYVRAGNSLTGRAAEFAVKTIKPAAHGRMPSSVTPIRTNP